MVNNRRHSLPTNWELSKLVDRLREPTPKKDEILSIAIAMEDKMTGSSSMGFIKKIFFQKLTGRSSETTARLSVLCDTYLSLREYGFELDTLNKLLLKTPRLLSCSYPELIVPKALFIEKEMGYHFGPEELSRYVFFYAFSLKQRYIPRHLLSVKHGNRLSMSNIRNKDSIFLRLNHYLADELENITLRSSEIIDGESPKQHYESYCENKERLLSI